MYTANTMCSSFEALGLSLMGSSSMANADDEKTDRPPQSARVLVDAVKANRRPRDIITRKSIENAVSVIMATGGSTNAVLHFLAIAHAAEVQWTIDDFERIRQRVPVLCDLKPSGRYVATELHKVGGVPQVMKILLEAGLLHGDCMTITGKTVAEELADIPASPRADQDVIRPIDRPMYEHGHLAILRGNLSPEGCVAKITGLKNPVMTGPARVFDSEDDAMAAIMARAHRRRRHRRDPLRGTARRTRHARDAGADRRAGRPGTRRVGRPDHRRPLLGRDLGDGRRARVARGVRRRHHRADRGRRLDHDRRPPAAAGTERRRRDDRGAARALAAPAPRYTRGVLAKFAKLASTASRGAVTDG